jgi:hypothetical protein
VEAVTKMVDRIDKALQREDRTHSNKLAFEQAETRLVNLIKQI